MENRDYEQEAAQEGWRPEEEWSGPSDKWVDAKTFVERGEKISGMLKKKLDTMERRLEQAEAANHQFGQYHREVLDKERKSASQRIDQLEGLLAQAIDNGDGQAYTQINREINDLKDNMPAEGGDQGDDLAAYQRMSQSWLAENNWYNTDQVLATYADGAADRLRQQGFRGKAYFDELTREVKEAFPEKFENPNRKREPSVGDGGDDDPDHKPAQKKTFTSLPKDAKDACKMFEAQGIMTRDEYLAQYDWDEEV